MNKLCVKEDKVTDEQVRGVTEQVDKLTSRLVNKLCVKEDKVTDEQVRGVTGQVNKLTVDG